MLDYDLFVKSFIQYFIRLQNMTWQCEDLNKVIEVAVSIRQLLDFKI